MAKHIHIHVGAAKTKDGRKQDLLGVAKKQREEAARLRDEYARLQANKPKTGDPRLGSHIIKMNSLKKRAEMLVEEAGKTEAAARMTKDKRLVKEDFKAAEVVEVGKNAFAVKVPNAAEYFLDPQTGHPFMSRASAEYYKNIIRASGAFPR